MRISLLLLILLLTQSFQLPADRDDYLVMTIIEVRSETSLPAEELEQVRQVLSERLVRQFDRDAVVTVEGGNRLRVMTTVSDTSREMMSRHDQYLLSHELEIWHTYRNDHPAVQTLLADLPELPGFFSITEKGPWRVEPTAIGWAEAPEDLDRIHRYISDRIVPDLNLKIYWASVQEDYETGTRRYYLYPIATQGRSVAPVTEANIAQTRASIDKWTNKPTVAFDLDRPATRIWSEMTASAARNNQSRIAIVINEWVRSAPSVMDQITSGKCWITGLDDLATAERLAEQLKIGRLPHQIEIIDQQIIRKE